MPWTIEDVDSHKKGLSSKQKRQWVHVANSALASCLKDGNKSRAECEASAIRQANASTSHKETRFHCECLSCGHKITSNQHCSDIKCPKCGGEMRRVERPGMGKEVNLRMVKAIEEKQIVYGIVWEPDFVDAHGEFASAEDIEDAAHDYLIKLQNSKGSRVKLSHEIEIDQYVDVVESYLAPVDFMVGDQLVKAQSWVVALKIHHSGLWEATKDEIHGLSAGGTKIFVE